MSPSAARMRLCLFLMFVCSCRGDRAPRDDDAFASLGADCQALMNAARRASACDEALERLATAIMAAPDEPACAHAVRAAMARRPTSGAVRSLLEPAEPSAHVPLHDAERGWIESMQLPAEIVVTPDLAPGPGVPVTSAWIDASPLDPDSHGRMRVWVVPGKHNLSLLHAGERDEYCALVHACDRVVVTAHGSQLAQHPSIQHGACGPEQRPQVSRRVER